MDLSERNIKNYKILVMHKRISYIFLLFFTFPNDQRLKEKILDQQKCLYVNDGFDYNDPILQIFGCY